MSTNNDNYQAKYEELLISFSSLAKENERLREALVKIANYKGFEQNNLINIPANIACRTLGID